MAVDEGFSVTPATAVPTSGLDLAKLASGRIVEARVASVTDGIALVAARHGTLQVDVSAFGDRLPAVGDAVRLQVQPIEGGGRPSVTVVEHTPLAGAAASAPQAAGDDPVAVLARAVREAAATQTGLAPLFSTLAGLASAPRDGVPESVRSLVAQLMGARLADAGAPSAEAVRRAFTGSGLFLEARRATAVGPDAAGGDLKGTLVSLRAALESWVGGRSATAGSGSAGATTTVGGGGTASAAGVVGGGPGDARRDGTGSVGAGGLAPLPESAARGTVGRLIGAAYGGGAAPGVVHPSPSGLSSGDGATGSAHAVSRAPATPPLGAPLATTSPVPVALPPGGSAAPTVISPPPTATGEVAATPLPSPGTASATPATSGRPAGSPTSAPPGGDRIEPNVASGGASALARPGGVVVTGSGGPIPAPLAASVVAASPSAPPPSVLAPSTAGGAAPSEPGPSAGSAITAAPVPKRTGEAPAIPVGPGAPPPVTGRATAPPSAPGAVPAAAGSIPAAGAATAPSVPGAPGVTPGMAPFAAAPPSSSGGTGTEAVALAAGTPVTAAAVGTSAPPVAAARAEDDAVTALVRAVVSGLGLAASLTAARSSEAMEAAAALATIGPERELKPPPPRRGQAPRGQAALPVDGVGPGGVEELARRALERTEGALARIRLEQFAALDRRGDDPVRAVDGGAQRQWTAEMPIATPQGTGVVQMTVERDGGRARAEGGKAPTAWRVRFSLDVEPLGPVHARIGLSGERLSIGLWAERPDAAARLGGDVGRLQGALEAAAIPVESIHLASGRPASDAAPASAGRFVDVKL